MTTAEILRRARNLPALDAEQAIAQAIVDIDADEMYAPEYEDTTIPVVVGPEADEMDAPADWDAGSVTFDPYVI